MLGVAPKLVPQALVGPWARGPVASRCSPGSEFGASSARGPVGPPPVGPWLVGARRDPNLVPQAPLVPWARGPVGPPPPPPQPRARVTFIVLSFFYSPKLFRVLLQQCQF